MKFSRQRLLILILAAGFLIRLALPFLLSQFAYTGDGYEYLRYAWNMDEHGVYSNAFDYEELKPTLNQMPGVPVLILFMLQFMDHMNKWIILPNILLSWGSLLLVWMILEKLSLFRKWGIALFAAYAVIPVTGFYIGKFYPLVPAAFFLLLYFYSFLRYREKQSVFWLLLMAASAAMGIYFRPDMGLVALLGLAGILLKEGISKQVLQKVALYSGMIMLIMLPWWIRNFQVTGTFVPLIHNYINEEAGMPADQSGCSRGLYTWLNTWHYQERHVKESVWEIGRSDMRQVPEEAFDHEAERRLFMEVFSDTLLTCGEDRAILEMAQEKMRSHGLRSYVKLPLLRMAFLLIRTERFDSLQSGKVPDWLLNLGFWVFAGFSNLVWLAGIFGLWKGRRLAFFQLLGLIFISRLAFFAWVYHVEYRYMLLVFPVMFVAAVWAVCGTARVNKE